MWTMLGSVVAAFLLVEVVMAVNIAANVEGISADDAALSSRHPVGWDPPTPSPPRQHSPVAPHNHPSHVADAPCFESSKCRNRCLGNFCPKLDKWCRKFDDTCEPGPKTEECCNDRSGFSEGRWIAGFGCGDEGYLKFTSMANLSLEEEHLRTSGGRGSDSCYGDSLEWLNKRIEKYCGCLSKCGGQSICDGTTKVADKVADVVC